jgi:hypothetical protein
MPLNEYTWFNGGIGFYLLPIFGLFIILLSPAILLFKRLTSLTIGFLLLLILNELSRLELHRYLQLNN